MKNKLLLCLNYKLNNNYIYQIKNFIIKFY